MKRENCSLRIKQVMLFFLFFSFHYVFCFGNQIPDSGRSCKLPNGNTRLDSREDNNLAVKTQKTLRTGDLYIMSHCPYGIQALSRLLEVKRYYGKFDFKVHFITALHGDKLTSLHGDKEVFEDKVWGLIQEGYPKNFLSFFACRLQNADSLWGCVDKIGVLRKQIESALDKRGKEILLKDYEQVQKHQIYASPTLFIDGIRYTGNLSVRDITTYLCADEKNNIICDTLPVCFENSDCNAGVKVGTCLNAGTVNSKCVFSDVVNVPLSIVEPDDAFFPRLDLEKDTTSFFPGVSIQRFLYTSKNGKKLLKKYGIKVLPAYIFGKSIEKTENFHEFTDGLINVKDVFIYDYKKIRANYFYTREKIPHTVNIFISPLSKISYINLRALQEYKILVKISYFVTTASDGRAITPGGNIGLEEICRQKALLEIAPSLYKRYIDVRDFSSSYWEDALLKIGVSPEKVKKAARSKKCLEYIRVEQDKTKMLGIEEDGAFLLNNRELLIIRNKDKFMKMLSKVSGALLE